MTEQEQRELSARSDAGRHALGVVAENGAAGSVDQIRGYLHAYAVAYAALVGWQEVTRLVQQLAHEHSVPLNSQKPYLVINNP